MQLVLHPLLNHNTICQKKLSVNRFLLAFFVLKLFFSNFFPSFFYTHIQMIRKQKPNPLFTESGCLTQNHAYFSCNQFDKCIKHDYKIRNCVHVWLLYIFFSLEIINQFATKWFMLIRLKYGSWTGWPERAWRRKKKEAMTSNRRNFT